MPIKWSALQVSEALDKVEGQLSLGESFIAQAEAEARKALKIANLPQYISQRLGRLVYMIERRGEVLAAIKRIREDIPQPDLKAQEKLAQYGSQNSLL
jgi:hypothetical protein